MKSFFLFLAALVIVLLSNLFSASAQICTWNGTVSNDWSNASNWTGGVPTSSSDVIINNFNATMSKSSGAGSPTVRSLSISNSVIELGNNFTGITISGNSVISGSITSVYTLKMSASTFQVQNTSFTMNITGSAPVTLASSILGNITTSATINYPVTITNGRTTGDDVSDQTVIVSGTSPSTTFNGSFTCSANCFKFTNAVFNGTTAITKTGTQTSLNNASNTFNNTVSGSTVTLANSGSGNISWGNGDIFNNGTALVSINNNSSGNFYIASIASTNALFKGPVTFTSATASSGKIILADASTNAVNFTATTLQNVYFYNNSTTTSPKGEIQISNAGAVSFDYSNVYLGCNGGYIYVGNTAGGSNKIVVTGNSKFGVIPSGISVPVFSTGELHIDRLQLNSSVSGYTAQWTLGSSVNAMINLKSGCIFNRPLILTGRRIIGIGGTYNSTAVFNNQSGAAAQTTDTYDQLTFNNDVSFVNMATVAWNIGGTTGSTPSNNNIYFNSPNSPTRSALLVQCNSTGDILFGYNPSTFTITNNAFKARRDITTAGSVYLGFKANINVISSNLSNSAARTDLTIEESGAVSGGGPSVSLGTNTPGTGYGTFTFNGVLNTTSFLGGIVIFGRYIANCDVNVTAGTSPDATTLISVSQYAAFNKNTYLKAPNITATGGVFGAAPVTSPPYVPSSYTWTSTIWRTSGAVATNPNYFTGTIVFNGPVTVTNLSSQALIFGNTVADVFTFNSDVTLQRSGTGDVRTSGLGISYYKGNYTYYGNPDATAMLGQSIFNGLVDQNIYCASLSQVLRFNILEVNKPAPISPALLNDVVLGSAVSVGGSSSQLKLTAGNIRTTASSLLTVEDGGIILNASENSFVDGPLSKIGLIPSGTDFTFQIGKSTITGSTVNKIFMPVSITVPTSATSAYTAEFFNQNQSVSNILGTGIADVQNCQYWTISHTGPNENIAVTLFWNINKVCYPVNQNVVCVAEYFGPSQWQNVGANNISITGNFGTVKSNVLANQLTGSFIYFSLGYRNALVINTYNTNPTKFKTYNNVETTPIFTSGSSGSSAGTKTILSGQKNVSGNIVIHPSFSSIVDLQIDELLTVSPVLDPKAEYANYRVLNTKIYTSASGAGSVVDHVTIDEDNDLTFVNLSSDVHTISGNTLNFFKERQSPITFDLTNNLTDAVTYTVNRYLTTPYTPFQITSSVPSGYSATLKIYDIGNVPLYTTGTLSWDAKSGATTFYPEGLYRYDVVLTNGTITKTYRGQLILKHQ